MRFITSAYVPPPVYTGLPLTYGDGTQTSGPGEWAFVPDIVAADYTTSTANKTATPANINTVMAGLADGDVVTLEDGNYSSLSLSSLAISVKIQAANLHGAVFSSSITVTSCTNIELHGIEASGVVWTGCTSSVGSYLFVNGGLICNQPDTTSITDNVNWYKCVADLAWPDPAVKGSVGFIRQVHGTFNGTVTAGAQNSTIKSCTFMRGTEDNMKVTWCRDIGLIDCLFWGCQVDSAEGDAQDIHPDAIQFSSQGADSTQQCQDTWLIGCAFINTTIAGLDEGQGLWMKDGVFARFKVDNCVMTSGLNSIALGCHNAHTATVIDRCSTTQHIRISGDTNTVQNSIWGVNNTSDGTTLPVYSGNVTYGYDDPALNVYETAKSGTAWVPANFVPQVEANWNNAGASELLGRMHTRMVEEGLSGFVPAGWAYT